MGINLKELGGQMSKCLKFYTEIEFKTDYHSKMRVCLHVNWRIESPNARHFPHWSWDSRIQIVINRPY